MKKILIVDDDEHILEVTKLILENEGFNVSTSSNVKNIQDLTRLHPDLILLDYWLPEKDGLKVAGIIRKQKKTQHIPIIMFSADYSVCTEVRHNGINDFLPKPFDIEDLIEKVKEQLAVKVSL